MQLGGPPRDRQPEPGAARFCAGAGFAFDETPEDIASGLNRNLRTEIDHIGHNSVVGFVLVRFNQHRRVVGGVLERVADDIREQLAQPVLVAFHRQIVRHMHVDGVGMAGIRDFQRLDGLVDKIGEIEPLDLQARRARLHTGQIEQECDQIAQSMRLVENALHIRRGRFDHAVGEILKHRLQRRNRCAQLMADVRNQIVAHLVGVLKLLGHFVERSGQHADLIIAVRAGLHAHGVVAFRHGFRGVSHLPQRRCQPA